MERALNGRVDAALVGPEDSGSSTVSFGGRIDVLADFSHCSRI